MKHLEYLKYLLRHKYFVMIECFREGLYWQGLMHDISHFFPSEFFPYSDYAFKYDMDVKRIEEGSTDNDDEVDKKFNFAWLLHKKRNKHHWQWWVEFDVRDGVMILEMEELYLKEMICDWIGAGKAQCYYRSKKDDRYFEVREWYAAHKNKIQLNEKTRRKVEEKIKWES